MEIETIMAELRSFRSDVRSDINNLHAKIDKVDEKVNKVDNGLTLFKGKAFGFMAVVSALFNAGLHFFGKK